MDIWWTLVNCEIDFWQPMETTIITMITAMVTDMVRPFTPERPLLRLLSRLLPGPQLLLLSRLLPGPQLLLLLNPLGLPLLPQLKLQLGLLP